MNLSCVYSDSLFSKLLCLIKIKVYVYARICKEYIQQLDINLGVVFDSVDLTASNI